MLTGDTDHLVPDQTEHRRQDLGEAFTTTGWGRRERYYRKNFGHARIAGPWQGEHGRGFALEAREAQEGRLVLYHGGSLEILARDEPRMAS